MRRKSWIWKKLHYYDFCESRYKLIFLKPFRKDKSVDINPYVEYITTWKGSWGQIDWEKDSKKKILQTITYFYNVGIDFNMKDDGMTPLMYAAKYSSAKVIDFLIGGGADPNIAGDEDGWTVLHCAADKGKVENIKCLIEKGARNVVNKKSVYGNTALHNAAWRGYTQSVVALIENGADINALNEYGQTPLHLAAENGYLETVKTLLTLGADAFIIDKLNTTAWSCTRTEKIRDVILDSKRIRNDYLKKNPVKVSTNSSNKNQALLSISHQYQ